jgi:hypothetical protein
MTFGHFFECRITFLVTRVPMQTLPPISKNIPQRVRRGERYPNAVAAVSTRFAGLDKIVLVVEIHGRDYT